MHKCAGPNIRRACVKHKLHHARHDAQLTGEFRVAQTGVHDIDNHALIAGRIASFGVLLLPEDQVAHQEDLQKLAERVLLHHGEQGVLARAPGDAVQHHGGRGVALGEGCEDVGVGGHDGEVRGGSLGSRRVAVFSSKGSRPWASRKVLSTLTVIVVS